jgi:cytidine deaminase
MQEAAGISLEAEGVHLPCSVTVCLCDDPYIAEINRQYRQIDRSTDVLSFPSVSYPEGKTAGECETLLRQEYDDGTGACFLGDLFISVPHMKAQAKEYGHSELREAVYLTVHGLCHLMGYDHIEPRDKEKMRKMEEKILNTAGIRRDESPAADDEALLALARDAMTRSYSPYSHYPVGAALRSKDGRVFQGCNIENASFGLTNCAERTAVFKAVSEGARSFDVIAVAANQTPWPCGACRQVLAEFSPDIRILLCHDGTVIEKRLSELLPYSIDLNAKENKE